MAAAEDHELFRLERGRRALRGQRRRGGRPAPRPDL